MLIPFFDIVLKKIKLYQKLRQRIFHILASAFHIKTLFYSASTGASTGQTPAHEPQLIQADSSITKQVSPCDIHPTGHSEAQAPQPIHFSQSILYAILFTTLPLKK